ncbi:hypothetical protein LCGC14_0959630 [marine sediment metagenome]|uniref:Uncharacterized protein n=1 Tax=marine sediment metagenome TaxID=412755 RepID=A0A0F9NJK1_9ZZZZ
MIELGPLFSPTWKGKPPRLSSSDRELWQAWMKIHAQEYDHFFYDVRLMADTEIPSTIEPEFVHMYKVNRARRIDSVAVKNNTALIIEYRDYAGLSAIGQILGYWALMMAENPFNKEIKVLLVTNAMEENVSRALFVASIPWEIVETEL